MNTSITQTYITLLHQSMKDDIEKAADKIVEKAKEEFARNLRQELVKHCDILLNAMTSFERMGTDLVITIKDPAKLELE